MKIVILDGRTLNPGDLSWEEFETMGQVVIYDRTEDELIEERSAGAEVLLTNKTPLTGETIGKLPKLRYIGVLATGYNVVDVSSAVAKGVTVTNVPAYSTESVAQATFALILGLVNHVESHSQAVKGGQWCDCNDFCFWNFPLVELAGKTMGIIGMGAIGRQVAKIAEAMGMKVIGYSRSRKDGPRVDQFEWTSLEEVFVRSDVVSLHVPLTDQTAGLVNRERLALMKPSAFLINTSRGGLVVESDLAEALNAGRLAGAGVDVLSSEPPTCDNPLLKAKNCIITPHVAWATYEARSRLMSMAVQNLRRFVDGDAINVVNR